MNGGHFHTIPRRVFFEWSPVHGAHGYGIEIDYYSGKWASQASKITHIDWVQNPSLDFDFHGDQPGAWRVWAMDKKGRPGELSAWSMFTFGPENSAMPAPPPDTPPDFSRLPDKPNVPFPLGKLRDLPVKDPRSGEACAWPAPQGLAAELKSGAVKMPRPIYTPEPQYADAARHAKAPGAVTLAVDIDENGRVRRVCILSASRDDLGLSSVEAVRTWRFQPATRDGKPIPYSLSVETSFHLY